jgi:hypothetical protein
LLADRVIEIKWRTTLWPIPLVKHLPLPCGGFIGLLAKLKPTDTRVEWEPYKPMNDDPVFYTQAQDAEAPARMNVIGCSKANTKRSPTCFR